MKALAAALFSRQAQEKDLAEGRIVFSTTDIQGEAESALIEAALVFDKPPGW